MKTKRPDALLKPPSKVTVLLAVVIALALGAAAGIGGHKWPESELKSRVETIQERTHHLRNLAMDALVELITELKAARAANVPPAQLAAAQDFQRKAQFYLDFIEAENSSGFHAPQEALRVLGESINFARKGQLALRPARETRNAP